MSQPGAGTDNSVSSGDSSAGNVPTWISFEPGSQDYCYESNSLKNTDVVKENSNVAIEEIKIPIDIVKSNINADCVSLDGSTIATASVTDDDSSPFFAENARDEVFVFDDDGNIPLYEDDLCYMVPTPKNGKPRNRTLMPISVAIVKTIGTVKTRKIFKVLLDSGSSKT